MARLLYLNNPQDHTVTWGGITMTWELIERMKAMGINPWTGRKTQ